MIHPSVPDGFCAAYFRGTRPGVEGLYNRLGRYIDRGDYSHCELIFSDGVSASASFLDHGVRFKNIGYSSVGNWDFLPLPEADDKAARAWFYEHDHCAYDVLGNLRFATNFARDSADKWFCSEALMAALGFDQAFRYGPCGSATVLQHFYNTKIIKVTA